MGNDLFFIVKIIDIVRKIFLTDGENIMQCPHCNVTLMMAERQGIEIDYCPKCRGVWLDRGELDKIIERAAADQAPPMRGSEERYREESRYRDDRDYGRKPRRKKSLLDDLFDF